MNEATLDLGTAILLAGTYSNPNKYHMCVVLNDPQLVEGRQVLYVPIITARRKFDETCVLDVGDHEFIKHKSCVHYAAMAQRRESHLLKVGKVRAPLRPCVLKRVLDGVMISPHSPLWTRGFLRI